MARPLADRRRAHAECRERLTAHSEHEKAVHVQKVSVRIVVGLVLASATQAPALGARPPMSVAVFLATHNRVSHSTREMALPYVVATSKLLLSAIQRSGAYAFRMNDAARRQGRSPLFCVPSGEKRLPITVEELHAFLETIPANSRHIPLNDAFLMFARAKFPCPVRPVTPLQLPLRV
jgi:hypothetical protein